MWIKKKPSNPFSTAEAKGQTVLGKTENRLFSGHSIWNVLIDFDWF